MPKITYVQPDGQRRSIEAEPGATVMLTAVTNGVPGIVAECGGATMCATCHVYVDEAGPGLLPPVSEVEVEMLASAASERRANSRLGCQVALPDGVAELVVHLPERQV